jgi:hypothetical protein
MPAAAREEFDPAVTPRASRTVADNAFQGIDTGQEGGASGDRTQNPRIENPLAPGHVQRGYHAFERRGANCSHRQVRVQVVRQVGVEGSIRTVRAGGWAVAR